MQLRLENNPPLTNRFRVSTSYSFQGGGSSYVSRNAAAIGNRAARIAGKSPPSNPSVAAHAIALVNNAGVTANANAIWLNVCQFIVAALKPSNAKYAAAAPTP